MLMHCSGAMSMLKLIMKKILGKKISSFPQMQLGTGHLEFTPKETPPKKRREEDRKKRNICLMPVLFTQMSLKRYPNLWMMTLLDL